MFVASGLVSNKQASRLHLKTNEGRRVPSLPKLSFPSRCTADRVPKISVTAPAAHSSSREETDEERAIMKMIEDCKKIAEASGPTGLSREEAEDLWGAVQLVCDEAGCRPMHPPEDAVANIPVMLRSLHDDDLQVVCDETGCSMQALTGKRAGLRQADGAAGSAALPEDVAELLDGVAKKAAQAPQDVA